MRRYPATGLFARRRCSIPVAAAYALLGQADPLAAAAAVVRGYHRENPLAEEEIAVRRMEEPLPTKPLRKVKLDEVDVPELEPLPEDDAPLNAKPLAKSDPED